MLKLMIVAGVIGLMSIVVILMVLPDTRNVLRAVMPAGQSVPAWVNSPLQKKNNGCYRDGQPIRCIKI